MARKRKPRYTTLDRPRAIRIGRALASPRGVLITVPLLVAAVGLGIMLVGREATTSATRSMARHQLAEQAKSVQADTAFALDQADALMKLLRPLADRNRPVDDVLVRLHDLISGRPGIAWLSISFPDGTFRGAEVKSDRHVELSESTAEPSEGRWFIIDGDKLRLVKTDSYNYDPRKRSFYQLAAKLGVRAWTEPYLFYQTHETGITCTEPVYDDSEQLVAVLTVDFHVGALSTFVARPAIRQARSVVFTADGTILAYPAAEKLDVPGIDRLLKVSDVNDSALSALYEKTRGGDALRYVQLEASDGEYLASVAPIGGKRAGVPAPLDWYVATLVPEHTLLGPTRQMLRSSIVASAGAIAIAVALALVLAWNLVRMRKQVQASREEARDAEARARELGSYRLVAKLGTGGMGEVWRAEHRLLARQAAIKLIRPEVMDDPEGAAEIRERFRREAQTLASMKSRHTIAIFDYGVTAEGIFYYVMELLDGLDLESLVMRYGAQPASRVIEIMAQACQSLAEAHDAGLYHRDIKPPNLFLSRAADEVDITKLLDFGIVQTMQPEPVRAPAAADKVITDSKLTQLGAMLGTPGFMAPEQILGMQLDGRADLYSLGCCAWWLLTAGEVYGREGGEGKVLHRHINEEIPPLHTKVRGWLPPELERVMRSLLAKDADDRPANARELAAQLRAIEIPAEHAWTQSRAAGWWRSYSPPTPAQTLPSGEVQVIMPGSTKELRPLAATDERAIAATLAGPSVDTKRDRESYPRMGNTSYDD